MKNKLCIKIGWLYPALMSTYGDRGNIHVLQKRCSWRGIDVSILPIDTNTRPHEITQADLIFGGGAQDKEQDIVMRDLKGGKGEIIKTQIMDGCPALFVCGSPQLMGNFYEPSEGKRIDGLGIFDIESYHPGARENRLIGNIAAEIIWENLYPASAANSNEALAISSYDYTHHPELAEGRSGFSGMRDKIKHLSDYANNIMVGFENHGGRTYLKNDAKPFARVLKGFGNNAEDNTEGIIFKNAVGTYLHGPLLPKNPNIADALIAKSLEIKYKHNFMLSPLNDELEKTAKHFMLKKLGIEVRPEKL